MRKKQIAKHVVLFLLILCTFVTSGSIASAKNYYKPGEYYNAKKKITLYVGSQWDRDNKVTVHTPRPGDPAHLDSYWFFRKKNKLKGDLGLKATITCKKGKIIWKANNGKKTKYSGTYKYVGKNVNY